MGLDELVDVDRLAENLGELLATRLLGLSRSVCEAARNISISSLAIFMHFAD